MLLKTKLFIPAVRPGLVPRPHLIERLDEGLCLGRELTLVSAPAGFGKTTYQPLSVSAWSPEEPCPKSQHPRSSRILPGARHFKRLQSHVTPGHLVGLKPSIRLALTAKLR